MQAKRHLAHLNFQITEDKAEKIVLVREIDVNKTVVVASNSSLKKAKISILNRMEDKEDRVEMLA